MEVRLSYSYQVPNGPFETFNARAKEASQGPNIPDDQRQGAADAANLATHIVGSGIVGDSEYVGASVSGHVQTPGTALPSYSISVYVSPAPPADEGQTQEPDTSEDAAE